MLFIARILRRIYDGLIDAESLNYHVFKWVHFTFSKMAFKKLAI